MSGKNLVYLLSFSFLFLGCARPNYAEDGSNGPSSGNEDRKVENCTLQFAKSGYCLDWKWIKVPTQSEVGSLEFKVFTLNSADQSAEPINPVSIPFVVLWMPEMGHGSSPTRVEQVDVGSYIVQDVFFVMPGKWQIKFQIKSGNEVDDEAIAEISI